jgi:hypothetical protein
MKMSDPCIRCGKPALYNRQLCHECATDEYLDDEMEGESWSDFLDDSVWEEEQDYQDPDYWEEDLDTDDWDED